MQSSVDAFINGHKATMPGLATLFQADALARLIEQYANAAAGDLRLEAEYIRFKPGSSCLVAYRGSKGHARFPCYAKAMSADNAHKLQKMKVRAAVAGPVGPGRIVIDELLLVIWFFPNDKGLRGLRRYLAANPGIKTLAYKPERRYVGLVERSSGKREVVKIYRRGAFKRALALARIADPIPILPDLTTVEQRRLALRLRWVDGVTIGERIRSGTVDRASCREAGRLISVLHDKVPPDGLRELDIGDENRRAIAIAQDMESLHPGLGRLAGETGRRLTAALARQRAAPVFGHGDFYANQVLLTQTGARLLDFDALALIQAEGDLGLFLAHLQFDALRGRLSRHDCDELGAAFIDGYRERRENDPLRTKLYTLFGMLQLAHRPFRDRMPEWPALAARWLETIDECLRTVVRESDTGPTGATAIESDRGPASAHAELRSALERTTGLAAVARALAGCAPQNTVTVSGATVLRHKPGRRALISYELDGSPPAGPAKVLGKIRFKGLDRRTFEFNVKLYRLISADTALKPLAIPRPLAEVPELSMWLQEWVQGESGWRALEAVDPDRHAVEIATALHRLHTASRVVDKRHGWREELTILGKQLDAALERMPARASRIRQLYAACSTIAGHLRNRPHCTVHRDFYPDQILLRTGEVVMLDLDLHCLGDPAVDIGNFIAHVQERDLRLLGDPYSNDEFCQRFADAYYELSDDEGLPFAVEIYRILSLARHVSISTRFDDRRAFSGDILALCEKEIHRLMHQDARPKIKQESQL